MSSPSPPQKIELREETEGNRVSVSDLVFFHAVGEPIRIKPEASAAGDNGGGSDSADWLPTQPIAVSEKHGLLFIAHSSGFCVARTKDVMEAAKEKGSGDCYVTEMSVVNVDIENVRSLSLSRDSSVVAVCAGPEVRFFSVDLLLNKEEGSLRSSTIDESTFIKDFRWLKTKDNAFTFLSGSGKLYNGSVGGPLKSRMDEVDAVECSLKGKSIVVARSNNLSVLTTKFKEKLRISLAVPSWMGESDGSYKVKVDSIRWVRPDSIVLGCFQLQSDGIEENYFLQVIRSKDGKITDISAEMVVQSFYYVFPGMIDDSVPPRNGPYLFLSYLEQCELAVAAHRKNTEEHMIFFSWSVNDAKDEVVFVEINRNKWLPKIELQENEEDNLILGLCSSKVSLDEKVRIQMSSDLREMELSPFSVIFSVTVEGKLVMHHISSNIELSDSSDVQASEEEEDTSAMTPSVQSSARGSSTLVKGFMDHSPIGGQFQDIRIIESNSRKEGETTAGPDLKPLKITQSQTPSFLANQTENDESIAVKWGFNSLALQQKSNSDAKQIARVGNQSVSVPSNEGTFGGLLSGVSPQLKMPTFTPPAFSEKSKPLTGQWKMESHTPQASVAYGRQHTQVDNHSVCAQPGQGLHGGKHGVLFQQSAPPFSLSKEMGSKKVTGDHDRLGSVETSRSLLQETPVVRGGSNNQYSPLQGEERSGTQLGKMKGMINELNALLSSLEEERGGFRDACTVAMKGLVETVENEVGTLSNQCLMWKGILNERENEIQGLLTKSIQAGAVKEHVEILLKQVSDPHYRELWSRQKLSAELELKRKNILKLNQELTYRLIELKRHLNSLELNKYGDATAAYQGRQASESGYGRRRSTTIGSRSAHSLQSLYSTITSQIASAEQLSDCLSRQMSALSVESPPSRPNNVKKELFDGIGLPYEVSFCSPDPGKLSSNSLDKRALIFSSNLVATKDLSTDIQSSSRQHNEPDTARRRRDSLGQSWKSFTPSKTMVKRILLQEQHDKTTHQSSKNDMNVESLQKSVLSHPNRTTPSTFKLQFENDGSLGEKLATESPLMPYNKVNEGARFISPTSQAGGVHQLLASKGSAGDGWNKMNIGNNFVSEKTIIGKTVEKSMSIKETRSKPAVVRESTYFHGSNVSTDSALKEVPTFSMKFPMNFPIQPSVTSSSILKERISTSSRSEIQKDKLKKDETPHVRSEKVDPSPSTAHAGPKPLSFAEIVPPFGAVEGQISPGGVTSSATTLEPAPSSLLSITSSSSAQPISFSVVKSANPFTGVSSVETPAISNTGNEASQSPLFGFMPSVSASPAASTIPLSSFSAPSSFTSSSLFQLKSTALQDKMPETVKLEVKPEEDKDILRLDATPSAEVVPSQSESLSGVSPVKIEAPAVMTPGTSGISPGMASKLQESSDRKGSLALNKLPGTPPEQLPVGNIAFPFALSTAGNFAGPKTDSVDIEASKEDEMEEEAPDINDKPDLGFGGLGGFGLGSTPSSNAPKGNPFGVSFSSAASTPMSSPFSMSVPSGELFRPASFSFQSPQTSQPSRSPTMGGFSGGFGVATAQAPTQSGFGQPAQIGPGQPALGSVLGTFGQSRQIGSGFAPSGGFGGGFPAAGSASGFAGATSSGGFASLTSSGSGFAGGGAAPAGGGFGGFASAAPAGGGFGGFASAAPTGCGFGGFAAASPSGGGFANAATDSGFSSTGFGFGAFGGQQGAGGFSAFGGSGAGNGKPAELFTQIRK